VKHVRYGKVAAGGRRGGKVREVWILAASSGEGDW
jgi:hypothetical protein